jgi:hypothetical protein
MTDLTKLLPTKSATVEAIEAYWKTRGSSEAPRGYLGASSIGKECSRELWYEFRKCSKPEFSGRIYRLFDRGHKEEFRFVEELRGIGCEVHEFDADGNQFEVIACDGHFKGHTDGAALGVIEAPKTWHLLEMKTSSSSLFKQIEKNGCEIAKPQHYAQMQVYMHLTGLKRALYLVVNKDTDELCTERLRYDSTIAQAYIDKAQSIINASTPPARISDREDSYACKFCDAKALCHGTSSVAVNVPELHCRQCAHSTPIADGKWLCEHTGKEALKVCDAHVFLPGLINFAEPTDSFTNKDGSTAVEFTSYDGSTVWHHGNDGDVGQYSSHMLMTMPRGLIELPSMKVSGAHSVNLEQKYSVSLDNVDTIWKGRVEDVRGEFESRYAVPMTNPTATQEGQGWTAAEFREQNVCAIIYGNSAELRQDNNQ